MWFAFKDAVRAWSRGFFLCKKKKIIVLAFFFLTKYYWIRVVMGLYRILLWTCPFLLKCDVWGSSLWAHCAPEQLTFLPSKSYMLRKPAFLLMWQSWKSNRPMLLVYQEEIMDWCNDFSYFYRKKPQINIENKKPNRYRKQIAPQIKTVKL